jgi:hypothetical protein
MLAILGTLISGVISGGATGLLGVLLQRWFDLKNRDRDIQIVQLNHQNALALAQMESERARIRADADMAIADRESEAKEEEAASRSLVASYEHDKANYLQPEAQKRKGWVGAAVTLMMALVGCLEVTRVASDGTTKNAASKALGAIMRAAAALGYKRLVSYTLATEAGTSYKACGWHQAAFVRGREWSCPSRKRKPSKQPVDKIRWEWHVKE